MLAWFWALASLASSPARLLVITKRPPPARWSAISPPPLNAPAWQQSSRITVVPAADSSTILLTVPALTAVERR
jgi:hypothetical protein